MAVRIREDGRILCAAVHPAEPGDTYLHDGLHGRLASGLGAIVTEPMHCDGGRRGHAYHGEWWWRDRIPADVEADPFYMERPLTKGRAFRALPKSARAVSTVVGLDVVALGACIVVVVHFGAWLRRVKRGYLCHNSPPFGWNRRGAYIGTAGVGV
jgi:hypothetical protein